MLVKIDLFYTKKIKHKTRVQMVQYSFLFIWQNNKKGSIWKEANSRVRKYKNIDKTNLTAVSIDFLFLSPNVVWGKKNLYLWIHIYHYDLYTHKTSFCTG